MKAAKLLLILVIVVAIFLFSFSGCTWGDNDRGGSSPRTTPEPGVSQAYRLTAAYGADQFHIQLTAIADSQVMGRNPANP